MVGPIHDNLGCHRDSRLNGCSGVGPLVGISISSDLIHQLGDQTVQVAQDLVRLFGIATTIYGHIRATTQLERKQVTLHL
jgi:hypothetical protein